MLTTEESKCFSIVSSTARANFREPDHHRFSQAESMIRVQKPSSAAPTHRSSGLKNLDVLKVKVSRLGRRLKTATSRQCQTRCGSTRARTPATVKHRLIQIRSKTKFESSLSQDSLKKKKEAGMTRTRSTSSGPKTNCKTALIKCQVRSRASFSKALINIIRRKWSMGRPRFAISVNMTWLIAFRETTLRP